MKRRQRGKWVRGFRSRAVSVGRKLNDQLTGFVETKLARGINGIRRGEREGGEGWVVMRGLGCRGVVVTQTDNKHCIPKGRNRKMRM